MDRAMFIGVAALLAGCAPETQPSGHCDNVRTGERATLTGYNFKYWFLEDTEGRVFTVRPDTGDWRCRMGRG